MLLFIAILYYAILSFKAVICLEQYDLVEEYRPIDFNDNNLTVGGFFRTIDLHIEFYLPYILSECSDYNENITFSSTNP